MSYEGYFDGIIKTWYDTEKKTPALKRDMKIILQQFETSLQFGEIPKDKVEDSKKNLKRYITRCMINEPSNYIW